MGVFGLDLSPQLPDSKPYPCIPCSYSSPPKDKYIWELLGSKENQ